MRYEMRTLFPQRAPRYDVRALLPWRRPRYDLSSWIADLAPRSGLRALLPRPTPRYDWRALLRRVDARSRWNQGVPRRTSIAVLIGALSVGALAIAIGIVIARRRAVHRHPEAVRGAPLRRLRGFVRRSWNPIVLRLGLAGGARSRWGLIEHVGRTSGHLYRTPVSPRPIEGGYELPLPYGTDVDWVRNVLASGQARIQFHDTIVELDQPEIVEAQDALSLPDAVRGTAQRLGYHYLRLHTVAEMPADFAHGEGHPAALTHGEAFPMAADGAFGSPFLAPEGVEVPVEPRMVERAPSEGEASPAS